MYVHSFLAVLTLHGTAPFELALTLGDLLDSRRVIAPPTAHDFTAICSTRSLVADTPSGTKRACGRVKKRWPL